MYALASETELRALGMGYRAKFIRYIDIHTYVSIYVYMPIYVCMYVCLYMYVCTSIWDGVEGLRNGV
jgi:hypothetical protein